MNNASLLATIICAGLCCWGCAVSPPDTAPPAAPESIERPVHQTIVRIAPDGTQTVTEQVISAKMYREMAADRRSARGGGKSVAPVAATTGNLAVTEEGVTIDTGCTSSSSLWMYPGSIAQWNCTGGSEGMLCLLGQGTVSLSSYSRKIWACSDCTQSCDPGYKSWRSCGGNWSQHVQSYWPGITGGLYDGQPGEFRDWSKVSCGCSLCAFCYSDFSANDDCTDANYTIQLSDELCLGPNC